MTAVLMALSQVCQDSLCFVMWHYQRLGVAINLDALNCFTIADATKSAVAQMMGMDLVIENNRAIA
jgi:hypothetical protein